MQLLANAASVDDATLITVTHDHELLDRFDRVIDFAAYHCEAASEDPAEAVG